MKVEVLKKKKGICISGLAAGCHLSIEERVSKNEKGICYSSLAAQWLFNREWQAAKPVKP